MNYVENIENDGIRHSGKTTRIVDAAIQEFFEKGVVEIIDHYRDGFDGSISKKKWSKHAIEVFITRLNVEHKGTKYQVKDNIISKTN